MNKDNYIIDINDNNNSDEWGYFIDIEEYDNEIKKQEEKYMKNTKENTTTMDKYLKKKQVDISLGTNMLIKISSTSLATILLTYIIICVT
jgi:uncharacterized membrane protein (DUF106 family)